jgi:hypothetical protein
MKKLWHRIEHYFGWFTGDVECWYQGKQLMVGFRCHTCGELTGIHEVPDNLFI